ncbi:MAG TPA: signal peptide peptidase SppA [Porphyromonadaceae bacterium]|nr:signal peptide peptidase SppA [Porphyromonadaceae bacterium]
MLKKFFQQLLSSFMGAWLAMVLFGAVAVIVIISLLASQGKAQTEQITDNSIMCLNLKGAIDETESSAEFSYPALLSGNIERPQSLRTLVKGLKEGADNRDIKALYIKCDGASASPATLHALREAVLDFKKSGKKVIAYADSYSQGDYYVASAADSVLLNRNGSVSLHGISGTTLYYKDLLDKIGVSFQVFKVGTYKSAVEPVLLNEMSEPARAQLDTLYREMWNFMGDEIAGSRNMKMTDIDSLVNSIIMLRDAEAALSAKLVDRLVNKRNVGDILARAAGVDIDDLNIVSASAVAHSSIDIAHGSDNQVAVLYACGEILEGSKDGIDCEKLVPIITDLADDDDVKALVLRVNSPGGSVFGSAEIGEALDYLKSKKKPVIVSMGDYAASGGYWISCCADKIYADPLTITGSIGIFGMVPQFTGLAHNLGISPQTVNTHAAGSYPNVFSPMTEAQSRVMQASIEDMYGKFVNRVATGRKMKAEDVEKFAEGRVWNAITAKKLGLVDELGSLDTAIAEAAKRAGIPNRYNVSVYPEAESSLLDMISELQNDGSMNALAKVLGQQYDIRLIYSVQRLLNRSHAQALMPVIIFDYQ